LISSNANGFFFEVDNGNGNGFVVENSSTDIPLLTIAHGPTDKPIQYSISGRDKDFFNLKDRVVSFREQLSITVCQYYYFQQQRHQYW
jgi:hypothetical protein